MKAIKKVEKWATVYFVQYTEGRPQFVSLKNKKYEEYLTPPLVEIELKTPRRRYKAWMAKITGPGKEYMFNRKFLTPTERKFDKKGEVSATFVVDQIGIYHDSDGDYTRASIKNGEMKLEVISYDEVRHLVDTKAVLV